MPSQSDLEHLLRRTEYVARPERMSALAALSAITGIYLNCVYWFKGSTKKKNQKIELTSEEVH